MELAIQRIKGRALEAAVVGRDRDIGRRIARRAAKRGLNVGRAMHLALEAGRLREHAEREFLRREVCGNRAADRHRAAHFETAVRALLAHELIDVDDVVQEVEVDIDIVDIIARDLAGVQPADDGELRVVVCAADLDVAAELAGDDVVLEVADCRDGIDVAVLDLDCAIDVYKRQGAVT